MLASKGKVIQMTTVREVMSSPVVTVRLTTPLKDVARLLVDNKVSGLPVVDVDGTVLGVVSEADFLIKEQGQDSVRHRPLARLIGDSRASRLQLDKVRATTAADAMTGPAITIESNRPITEAARVMTQRKVNRLPVVDGERLVGIITRADLVRAYARSDEELADMIREDVIKRALWLDPASFAVEVKDGIASISGHVDRKSTAEMVAHATSLVPGIVDVQTRISWAMDDSRIQPAPVDLVTTFGPR